MVQQVQDGSSPKDILSSTTFARTSGFSGVQGETAVSLAPIWSPDGKEVVFAATTERWNAAFAHVGYHLYRLPAAGGTEPTVITPAAGEYKEAVFAADGKALFFKYAPIDGEIYPLERLQRVPWPAAGEPTPVTRDFDREVSGYALTPDSRTVYLRTPEAGKENLYRVPAAGGQPSLVIGLSSGGYTALVSAQQAARPVLIASYGSSVSPLEILRIDP